jgi:hypothetical protein
MRIVLPTESEKLTPYLGRFLALAGAEAWEKRMRQLVQDMRRSEAQVKIVSDYHWLEIFLSEQADAVAARGDLDAPTMPEDFAVLQFAGIVVEVFQRLSPQGQRALQGRLRSALTAETGFAALYLEMDMARRLFNEGNEVEFPDLEGMAQYDLHFSNERVSGELECKSLSADAGRKIHRKDFYRLLEKVQMQLLRRAESGAREILVVTLTDRLPSQAARQQQICVAIQRIVGDSSLTTLEGEFFSITREDFRPPLDEVRADEREFYKACVRIYGENVHVAGPMPEQGRCILVMRCILEDDTSKPWLEAMEKAVTQFSGTRPGFIAVQFNDLAPHELMTPSLRRRAAILFNAIIRRPDALHVAATFHCPYRGLVAAPGGVGAPGFSILNLECTFPINMADYSALLGSVPDEEFARLIGS